MLFACDHEMKKYSFRYRWNKTYSICFTPSHQCQC